MAPTLCATLIENAGEVVRMGFEHMALHWTHGERQGLYDILTNATFWREDIYDKWEVRDSMMDTKEGKSYH